MSKIYEDDFKMKDWRLTNQKKYLNRKKLIQLHYNDKKSKTDHDHCEFCGKIFENDIFGYTTLNHYWWICEKCYNDFLYSFKWKVVQQNRFSLTKWFGKLTSKKINEN